ncbi:MAG: hypothetical protein MI919_11885 [Holophagales bacterium]|nr:hypothetical protein [Holophagales bacterium]
MAHRPTHIRPGDSPYEGARPAPRARAECRIIRREPVSLRRRSYALFAVLIAVLLLVAVGGLLASYLVRRMSLVADQHRDLHVQALLDSGLALSLALIRQDFDYEGAVSATMDGGSVRYSITRQSLKLRSVDLSSFYRGETRRAVATVYIESPLHLPEVRRWDLLPPPVQQTSPAFEIPDSGL